MARVITMLLQRVAVIELLFIPIVTAILSAVISLFSTNNRTRNAQKCKSLFYVL